MAAKEVPMHRLGKNGPLVPAMGLGLMGLSFGVYGSYPDEAGQFAILDRAVELGSTFWDTADMYGDNELVLGKWFKRTGKRDQIFIASKFGFIKGSKKYEVNSSGPYCKECCEESLKRLGVDHIDLYYMHSANWETPIEETMRALAELKKEGKIKYIGLSTVSSKTLRRACKVAHVDAVQTDYNVLSREIEGPAGTNLLATARELGVAVVVAMPLGRGLLTPTFSTGASLNEGADVRNSVLPRFQEGNREKNIDTVTQFTALADKKGCTVAQLALAWLLKQGDDIFPIPGTKQIKYLEQNWAALDVHLTDAEEAEVRAFAEKVDIAGAPTPAGMEDVIFRNTKEES